MDVLVVLLNPGVHLFGFVFVVAPCMTRVLDLSVGGAFNLSFNGGRVGATVGGGGVEAAGEEEEEAGEALPFPLTSQGFEVSSWPPLPVVAMYNHIVISLPPRTGAGVRRLVL